MRPGGIAPEIRRRKAPVGTGAIVSLTARAATRGVKSVLHLSSTCARDFVKLNFNNHLIIA